MNRRCWALSVSLAFSALAPGVTLAMDDAIVSSTFSGLPSFGAFTTHRPVALSEVVDMRKVEDASVMGVNCNGFYRIVSKEKPENYVRNATEATLETLGLAPVAGETPSLTLAVRIWRAHAWCYRTMSGGMLRLELNLEFDLATPAGETVGRAYALGDAQSRVMSFISKKPWAANFDEALYDAMEEFAGSEELRQALGPDVAASFQPPRPPRPRVPKAHRIDYSKRTGPSPLVNHLPAVDLSAYGALELETFEMADQSFLKEHNEKQLEAARGALPDAVFERLGGLYPGLFAELVRGDRSVRTGAETGKRLIVRGRYRDFESGEVWLRAFIGFGAGRVSFDVDVSLVDAESGAELATFRMDTINAGSAQGEIEDVVDRAAADIVYYLQKHRAPGYTSALIARHTAR